MQKNKMPVPTEAQEQMTLFSWAAMQSGKSVSYTHLDVYKRQIMFSKKKTECRVCGYRFTPERENIYTAEEPRSALEMLTAAPTRFSAVDCPICGDVYKRQRFPSRW